jgi:signal transduction histidine kinase
MTNSVLAPKEYNKLNIIDTVSVEIDFSASLDKTLWYLRTPTKNLPLSSVIEKYNSGTFKSWDKDRYKQFYNDDHYWLTGKIKNRSQNLQEMFLVFSGIGYTVAIYQLKNDALVLIDSSSTHTPLKDRPSRFRNLAFPITLAADSTIQLFFKVEKTMVRHAVFKFELIDEKLFVIDELKRNFLMFLYIGFFLFSMIFTAIIYYVFRERVHLYQLIYIMLAIIFTLYILNFFVYLFDGEFFIIASSIPTPMLPFLCVVALYLVFMEMAKTSRFPSIHRLLKATLFLLVFTLLCSLCSFVLYFIMPPALFKKVDNILRLPTFIIVNIYGIVMLVSIIYLMPKVATYVRIFFIALLLSLFFWTLAFLEFSGLGTYTIIPPNNLVVAHAIEIFVFLILSIYHFWVERKEKVDLLESKLMLQEKLVYATIEAQESERKRIAQELHDGLGGFLSALRMKVNSKKNSLKGNGNTILEETLLDLENKLDEAIKDVREISHNLMPSDFESKDFSQILEDHIQYHTENGKIIFEYYIDKKINKYPKLLLLNIYRIIVELLRNIQNHSGATQAYLQLIEHNEHILLQIEDNGNGFDITKSKDGIGIKNIKSRLEFYNASIKIDSGKLGTTIIIEIPKGNGN